jgi:tRNA pseudouridine55 synthase
MSKMAAHPMMNNTAAETKEGLVLVNKPQGRTSFSLIHAMRKLTGVKKIGHAGTLDPFATGVMVIFVGKNFTKLSDKFLMGDKEYVGQVYLGVSTDTYDCDGKVVAQSKKVPTIEEIEKAIAHFQGEIEQIPPMFSAKKVKGKKLYELARKGIEIERSAAKIQVTVELISYNYPDLIINIRCSKGTYIRSIAHEMGVMLGCGAHLAQLKRTRSGNFRLEECIEGSLLDDPAFDVVPFLRKHYEDIR